MMTHLLLDLSTLFVSSSKLYLRALYPLSAIV